MEQSPERSPPSHKTVSHHIDGIVPVVEEQTSINDARAMVRSRANTFEDITHIYVIGKNKTFIGVAPLSSLLQAQNGEDHIKTLVQKDFPVIHQHTHQEHALRVAIEHNVMGLPVVDKAGVFIGALTPKDLMVILKEEHVEDMLHFGGIHTDQPFTEIFKAKVRSMIVLRLPWLITGLMGGMIATFIVQFFEEALHAKLALAFFIPVIVYMSSAVGTQTQTIFIRGLALGKVNVRRYFGRELIISFAIGIISSILIFAYTFALFSDLIVASIVSLAMLINITFSVLVAIFIPWLLLKSGKDPAIGSGPFATIIQDIVSIVIYFAIAFSILP